MSTKALYILNTPAYRILGYYTSGRLHVASSKELSTRPRISAFRFKPMHTLVKLLSRYSLRGTWWRLGLDDIFQPEGSGLDSRSSRHVGTLGKSFTCSCLALRRETPIPYPCCSRERL